MYLKILQNSQENSCARVTCFNKVAAYKETLPQVFSYGYSEIFKNTFF